jgi:hypothetical protein
MVPGRAIFGAKYKRQWSNVIFLQDKHNINAVSENIKYICIRRKAGEMLGETRIYPCF